MLRYRNDWKLGRWRVGPGREQILFHRRRFRRDSGFQSGEAVCAGVRAGAFSVSNDGRQSAIGLLGTAGVAGWQVRLSLQATGRERRHQECSEAGPAAHSRGCCSEGTPGGMGEACKQLLTPGTRRLQQVAVLTQTP